MVAGSSQGIRRVQVALRQPVQVRPAHGWISRPWELSDECPFLDQARVLWLPSIYLGPNWIRHDGQVQTVQGPIQNVSKSSLFLGGTAAAGSPARRCVFMASRTASCDVLESCSVAFRLARSERPAVNARATLQFLLTVFTRGILRCSTMIPLNSEALFGA